MEMAFNKLLVQKLSCFSKARLGWHYVLSN